MVIMLIMVLQPFPVHFRVISHAPARFLGHGEITFSPDRGRIWCVREHPSADASLSLNVRQMRSHHRRKWRKPQVAETPCGEVDQSCENNVEETPLYSIIRL